jgi:hypothetical protein
MLLLAAVTAHSLLPLRALLKDSIEPIARALLVVSGSAAKLIDHRVYEKPEWRQFQEFNAARGIGF